MSNSIASKPFNGVFRLLRDSSGNIMPMAAIGTVVLAGLVGGGVDVSRGYMVQNRLQNACDAGVLAGRRAIDTNGFDTNAQDRANSYFNTNFNASESGVTDTVFNPTSPDNGNTITATASATLDTTVMAIFNYDAMPLSVTCSASMSVGNSDIMMVLDTTGSMGWELGSSGDDRIDVLQDSMKSFYDTVAAATSGSNARIRYGFVPYSSSVNVGSILHATNPDYLADEAEYPSKRPITEEVTVDTLVGYEDPVITTDSSTGSTSNGWWRRDTSNNWKWSSSCNNNLPADTAWANSGSSYTDTNSYTTSTGQEVETETLIQPQTRTDYTCGKRRGRWYVYYRTQYRDLETTTYATSEPIYTTTTQTVFKEWKYRDHTYDTSVYKTFQPATVDLGTDGTDINYSWNGCIQERKTVSENSFSWSSLTGLNHSDALDLDIDSAPNSSDPDTQWKPMWPEVSYRRYTSSSKSYYSSAPESSYGSIASSRCPIAAQQFTTMTEADFDLYADSLNTQGNTFHSIGMIWGARMASPDGIFGTNVNATPANGGSVARHIIFMTDGEMDTSYSQQTAWGMEYWDRRVTDDGSSNQDERHTERFLAACEVAKSKGIRLWVIAFDTSLTTDLVTCASDESTFLASSASQLNSAFQEIAKDVGELRITQ